MSTLFYVEVSFEISQRVTEISSQLTQQVIERIFLDPMVLEKLGNLTDPISPAECDDRIIFIESEELFVNRCGRTNAALSYPSQLQREEICKAYTQDQQRIRKNNSVGVLNPSLCDFQSKVGRTRSFV